MDKQYSNEMRFVLFKNDKQDNPARPDYRGSLQINGEKFILSGWKKTSRAGESFLAGEIQSEKAKPESAKDGFAKMKAATETPGDDVPF